MSVNKTVRKGTKKKRNFGWSGRGGGGPGKGCPEEEGLGGVSGARVSREGRSRRSGLNNNVGLKSVWPW